MKDTIQKILSLAIQAPSGDNSQPWSFVITENSLDIINLPDRDNEIFNFEQHGSYIAHGALIENIYQLSPHFGFSASIQLFPNPQNHNMVATITFSKTKEIANPQLIETILGRCTNRKKYLSYTLQHVEKEKLLQCNSTELGLTLLLTEHEQAISQIAHAVSTAEYTMLQYKPLHKAFFDTIRWNKKQEAQSRHGMLIDALELLPPQKLIFKWFSHWNAASVLRAIGLPAFIAKENTRIYESSSAIGAIIAKNDAKESFVATGRFLQKIWLEATALGLSMQPIAGVLYLNDSLKGHRLTDTPQTLSTKISLAAEIIYSALNSPEDKITMLFRIGKSNPPTARSTKFLPHI